MVSENLHELLNDDGGATANGGLADVQRQIRSHEERDESKSYLGRAISFVWGEDEKSLSRLQDLQRSAKAAQDAGDKVTLAKVETQIAQQITADRKAVALQDEIGHYAGGFLKTGGLFLRGKVGLAGTVCLFALDQMNPRDSFKTQVADMTLGGSKGALMRGAFHFLGQKDVSVAAKGVGLGITSRSLDLALTRGTYMNSSGEFSLSEGLTRTLHGSLNKTALATDVVVFGGAHGLLKGTDQLAGGVIKRSPLLSTMLTGTTFGISAGATGEVLRQQSAGESFDVWKVAKRGMLQGAVDTFASAPGGLQARAAQRQLELRNGADALAQPRDLSRDSAGSVTQSSAQEFVVIRLSVGERPSAGELNGFSEAVRLGRPAAAEKQPQLERAQVDEPKSTVRKVERTTEQAAVRALSQPDNAQLSLKNATLEYLGQEPTGGSKIELHRYRATLPDGTTMDVVFRPSDIVEHSQTRFRREGAGYKLNGLIGFDNGFPVTVDRAVEVSGTTRPGWVQEWAGPTLAEALPAMAKAKFPGKDVKEAVISLIESDPALKLQLEQAFAERLVYGVEDFHEWNMLVVSKQGKVKVPNIDFDFSFTRSKKPKWGTDDDQGIADVIRDHFFAGKQLSDLTRGKIQVFVDGYDRPAGRKSLTETGLTPGEIEAMMARATLLAKTGKFPLSEARKTESTVQRPIRAGEVENMRNVLPPATFERWKSLMVKNGRLSPADAGDMRAATDAAATAVPSSAREFVVTNGQDTLTSFSANNSSAAWLRVREVLRRSADGRAELGIERTLMLQHRDGRNGLLESAKEADIVATCNPETLSSTLRAKHVFGTSEGPVWLSMTNGGERLELSIGNRPAESRGYEQVLQLGLSREVKEVMRRAESGDRRVKEVGMDEIGRLTAKIGDQDKVIFTPSLGGCTAVALVVERPDGTRTAIMSHEMPYNSVTQFQKIQKTARAIPGLFDPGTKVTALVLTAEAIDGNPFSGQMKSQRGVSGDPGGEAHLIESLKSQLGVTDIKRMTYDATARYSMRTDEGVLLLRLPAGRPPTFKTWFSKEMPFDFSTAGNDNGLPVAAPSVALEPPVAQSVEKKLAG